MCRVLIAPKKYLVLDPTPQTPFTLGGPSAKASSRRLVYSSALHICVHADWNHSKTPSILDEVRAERRGHWRFGSKHLMTFSVSEESMDERLCVVSR
jgi:hypothetical protein